MAANTIITPETPEQQNMAKYQHSQVRQAKRKAERLQADMKQTVREMQDMLKLLDERGAVGALNFSYATSPGWLSRQAAAIEAQTEALRTQLHDLAGLQFALGKFVDLEDKATWQED